MGVKVFVSGSTADMKVRQGDYIELSKYNQKYPTPHQTLQNQQRIMTILKSLEVDFVQVSFSKVSQIENRHLTNVLIIPDICSLVCQFCLFYFISGRPHFSWTGGSERVYAKESKGFEICA